jgi:hypothetical protein
MDSMRLVSIIPVFMHSSFGQDRSACIANDQANMRRSAISHGAKVTREKSSF